MLNKTLVIAAPSARAYAQAAVACGFEVITLDAFADAQTEAIAKQTYQLAYDAHGVSEADFKFAFSQLALSQVHGVLYGSYFDGKPDLLSWVAKRASLLGNPPKVMQFAKSAAFFNLLDALDIQYPDVSFCANDTIEGDWLSKQFGGTGGTHIQPKQTQCTLPYYFQRKIAGDAVSLLFIAHDNSAQLVGFNRQLLAPTEVMPYRFAGAVGCIQLPKLAQNLLLQAAQKLTHALGLRGLNSIDAIWTGKALYMLELNPRLSATFSLYPNLLYAHLQACTGQKVNLAKISQQACAEMICYAECDVTIYADFVWPSWVTDTPVVKNKTPSDKITKNYPICSVQAQAGNAQAAYQLLQQRMRLLNKQLKNFKKRDD